jgi:hypothetical protein
MKPRTWSSQLRQKAKRRQGQYPVATVAFYGPDNRHASKVAVGILIREDAEVDPLERWYSEDLDIRVDKRVGEAVAAFIRGHGVRSVVMAEGIIGCPHEEGIDYPDGAECPECEFWKGKDRFEHAVPNNTEGEANRDRGT